MPSKSKSQQRLMGQAYAYKIGEIKDKDLNIDYADEIKKLAKSMTKKQLKDFASTKHKGLPNKKKNESRIMNFELFNENSSSEIEKLKSEIDNMSHYELANIWRHGSDNNKLLQGEVGEYFKNRLFNHFGGFNSSLSKKIGW